jgi:predicted aspartyl protease
LGEGGDSVQAIWSIAMWNRRTLMTGLAGALAAGPAFGQEAAPSVLPANVFIDDPRFVVDTSADANRRMTLPVWIDGRGPFQFVVDTGADRTVISSSLALRLGLPPGPELTVHSIAGSMPAPTRRVKSLRFGKIELRDLTTPILSAVNLGADGLLGVDALQGRTVFMDFRKGELTVQRPIARNMRARAPNEAIITAATAFGRLTVIDTRVEGVRATAFMDSGGGVTIGNPALAQAIRKRLKATDTDAAIRLVGVTGQSVNGVARVARHIDMDQVRVSNIPMAFCNLHLFDMWGLRDRPALLLGVDVMRMFSRVELDFGNKAVLFKVGAFTPALPQSLQARLGMPQGLG